ncbi:MAG TPA: VanZ family protein [Kofleriaceae bacterium]|nr:VanZ family protein [Kofleriaceae bacterium]
MSEMSSRDTHLRRLGLGLAAGTVLAAIVATQWPFHYQLTRFAIHHHWARIDWRWLPRTGTGHVRDERDLVLNLLMLIPLGIGFALWRRASGARVVFEALLLGIVTSTTLELAQLATAYRHTTLADVWCNAIGCMAGAIMVVALRRAATVSGSL